MSDEGIDSNSLAQRKKLEGEFIRFNEEVLFRQIPKGDIEKLKAFFYDTENVLKKQYEEFEAATLKELRPLY